MAKYIHNGQDGQSSPDETFEFISLNENRCIMIKIFLKLVPMWPFNNKRNRGKAIICTNNDLVHGHMHALPGVNESTDQ